MAIITYQFDGQSYTERSSLCHAIVKHYVEQQIEKRQFVNLQVLQNAFNSATDTNILDARRASGLSNQWKTEDPIPLTFHSVVVRNYWPGRLFAPFLERVKNLGYFIEIQRREEGINDAKGSKCYYVTLAWFQDMEPNKTIYAKNLESAINIANEYAMSQSYEPDWFIVESDDGTEYYNSLPRDMW